jgi:hypothetical protein
VDSAWSQGAQMTLYNPEILEAFIETVQLKLVDDV